MNVLKTVRTFVYSRFIVVLIFLLLFTIGTKLFAVYFNPSRILTMPEQKFSSPRIGRDLTAYTVNPVYEIRKGTVPFIFGYGSVTLADFVIRPLEFFHICTETSAISCDYFLYIALIIFSVTGLITLAMLIPSEDHSRTLAGLLCCLTLLGVPFTKAIEAGNIDTLLAVFFGVVLYLLRKSHMFLLSIPQSILLGTMLGILLSTKAFFVLFIGVSLFLYFGNIYVYTAFLTSYSMLSLWPRAYGVTAGFFDVFAFAMRGAEAFGPQLFTQINYGNNALVSYVSNILQIFDIGPVSLTVHTILTYIVAGIVWCGVFIYPLYAERITRKHFVSFFRTPRILPYIVYTTAAMIIIPTWSYDYRLVYLFPVVVLALRLVTQKHAKELLYWAIIMLVLKSVWIPKDRLLTVFLYAHLYLLIRASVAQWKYEQFTTRTSQ